MKAAVGVVYSRKSSQAIESEIRRFSPDLVHVHNYFPLISPAVFYVCKYLGVPVVHTLHNYRAICPTATFFHKGRIEERSLKESSWWTASKKVYRESYIGSFIVATMVEAHKYLGTWQNKVDRFIALTDFSRKKYIDAGWPESKISIKPNFIEDPFTDRKVFRKTDAYGVFVGRLSEEKGVNVLIDAWKNINFPLKIIGEGPLESIVSNKSADSLEFLGRQDRRSTLDFMRNADFIIVPSLCYETFGVVIIESFACGTPVIASRLGSFETMIEDGVTGLLFEPGSSESLIEKVQWMMHNRNLVFEMGLRARHEYLEKYTPENNYKITMGVYEQAIEEAKGRQW
ncbi:glycosyltransferase family 4 protein [Microbulbifer taiwanensis]|uniref:glycosyltransferase family 4 protein n=1 Tax=Microbulbifer taiwanensis TaxID=986746 RepID=UPI003623EA90